jgi:excisionase family DNA binding protein
VVGDGRAAMSARRPPRGPPTVPDDGAAEPPDLLGEILTSEQVAQLLAMRRSTVEDYARRGVLPSIKLGRHRRYLRSDLAHMIIALRDR